jgi:hypothetical protein
VTPAILWRTTLGADFPDYPGVAVADDHVFASAGQGWFAFDRHSGTLVSSGVVPENMNFLPGSPALSADGTIYVQSDIALHAFSFDGKERWHQGLPALGVSSEGVYAGRTTPSVVGDTEVLAVSPLDAVGLDANGVSLWHVNGFGAGRTVGHWGLGVDQSSSYVLDLRTGAPAGRLRAGTGHEVVGLLPVAGGLLGIDYDNSQGLQMVLLDTCGAETWRTRVSDARRCFDASDIVVGPDGTTYLVVSACRDQAPFQEIVALDEAGSVTARIESTQFPLAAGADGTIYAVDLDPTASDPQLVALSSDLHEQWRLPLGGSLRYGTSGALTADGVLYVPMSGKMGSEIVALQTTSPGPALTTWPTLRADNRSSNWAGGQF